MFDNRADTASAATFKKFGCVCVMGVGAGGGGEQISYICSVFGSLIYLWFLWHLDRKNTGSIPEVHFNVSSTVVQL